VKNCDVRAVVALPSRSLMPFPVRLLQIADPTFFMKTLPLLDDGDDIAMVLSPQCFHNVHHQADIFNHTNIHFWEYMQVGYDALSFISCTGARCSEPAVRLAAAPFSCEQVPASSCFRMLFALLFRARVRPLIPASAAQAPTF